MLQIAKTTSHPATTNFNLDTKVNIYKKPNYLVNFSQSTSNCHVSLVRLFTGPSEDELCESKVNSSIISSSSLFNISDITYFLWPYKINFLPSLYLMKPWIKSYWKSKLFICLTNHIAQKTPTRNGPEITYIPPPMHCEKWPSLSSVLLGGREANFKLTALF